MKSKLLADCGATSSRWVVGNGDHSTARFTLTGINAATMADADITAILLEVKSRVRELTPDGTLNSAAIFAAGARGASAARLHDIASEILGCEVSVGSDMTLAATATLGSKSGIACILGTGSNSCLWDGEAIIGQTPSLGYILGDEGSGASLGRRLITDRLKGLLPQSTADSLDATFPDLTVDTAIERVYRNAGGNRWLASFVPFLADHRDDSAIDAIITDELTRFFDRNIAPYNTPAGTPISFAGGVAAAFADKLCAIARARGLDPLTPVADPLERLVGTLHASSDTPAR